MQPRVKLISEILTEVGKEPSRKKKIELLQNYDKTHKALRIILKGALDPSIKFLLPEGEPPYKKVDDTVDNTGGLQVESRKFYLFVENAQSGQIKQAKREHLFIEMLESLHPDEAKLVIAMKDKTMPYNGVTLKLVQEAFPGLIK